MADSTKTLPPGDRAFTVIVAGAGPAGLACATLLARAGVDVLVLDRKKRIGPKPCGGGITWSGLIKRVPESLIDRSFTTQHIRTPWQRFVLGQETPIIATVQRERLGAWMLDQAREAGAVVLTEAPLLEITDREVLARQGDGEPRRFGYRYLVGADGSTSLVRRYLKIATARQGVGVHYRVAGDFRDMEWHLDSSRFENGYGWIFPYRGMASVGAYCDRDRLAPRLLLERLHGWAAALRIDLRGLQPEAGLINFDYRGWRFGNIFLVGDAAGLASGLTGEGMFPAIVSGEAAARTILDPSYGADELASLVRRQKKHRQVLDFSGRNTVLCRLTMETLSLGLRSGLIPIRALEMGL